MKFYNCPICDAPCEIYSMTSGGDGNEYKCIRCGKFALTGTAKTIAESGETMSILQIANLSGWIREHQKEIIDSNQFKKLRNINSPSTGEKGNKLLAYFARLYPKAGELIEIPTGKALASLKDGIRTKNWRVPPQPTEIKFLPLLAASWTQDLDELSYIIEKYLINEKKLIQYHPMPANKSYLSLISPKGWSFLEKNKSEEIDTQMAFIGIWFDPRMDEVSKIIEETIESTGYEPIRVDKHEHTNRIDDEIISLIRQSKFVVADYSGQRGGVYFESGFALGLGKKVFWLCNKSDEENLHFDTNHYNFIFWEENKFDLLKNNLKRRIEAVLGKGTYIRPTH